MTLFGEYINLSLNVDKTWVKPHCEATFANFAIITDSSALAQK
jgi:hypothetical protein